MLSKINIIGNYVGNPFCTIKMHLGIFLTKTSQVG